MPHRLTAASSVRTCTIRDFTWVVDPLLIDLSGNATYKGLSDPECYDEPDE